MIPGCSVHVCVCHISYKFYPRFGKDLVKICPSFDIGAGGGVFLCMLRFVYIVVVTSYFRHTVGWWRRLLVTGYWFLV